MVEYKFDKDGGFFAFEPATGYAAYAYPSSHHATKARRNPERIAAEMVAAYGSQMTMLPMFAEHCAYIRSRMIAE